MKCFQMFLLIISFAVLCQGFAISNVSKYFETLKEFCKNGLNQFCNEEQMQMSKIYLKNMKDEVSEIIKEIQAVKDEQRERRRKLRKSKEIEQKFREHFLDRHI